MLKVQKPIPFKTKTDSNFFILTDENCNVIRISTYLNNITGTDHPDYPSFSVSSLFETESLVTGYSTLAKAAASGSPFYAKAVLRTGYSKKLNLLWVVTPVACKDSCEQKQLEWSGCELREVIWYEPSGAKAFDDFLNSWMKVRCKLSYDLHLHAACREIAEDTKAMIAITDVNNALLYTNRHWLAYTGGSLHEPERGALHQFMRYADPRIDCQVENEYSMHPHPSSCMCQLKHHSGEYRWMLNNSLPVFRNDGAFFGHIHFLLRIQDYQITEEKIKYHSSLLENVSDSIISTDLNTKILTWNKAAEKTYGYSAQEVIGRALSDFVHYEYQGGTIAEAFRQLHENGIWEGEVIYNRKDGAKTYLQASVSWIRDENGEVVGMVAVNRDITEKKEAEKALRESETRFRFLCENTRTLICLHAPGGSLLYVSPSAASMLGYSPDELAGKTLSGFFHPEDQAKAASCFDPAGDPGNTVLQGKFIKKDGACIWLEIVVQTIYDADNKVVSFQSSSMDITSGKLEELAIRTRELEFRTLAVNAPVLIQRMDRQHRYTYCNPMVGKVFHVDVSWLIGLTPAEAGLSGNELMVFTEAAEAVFTEGKRRTLTMDFITSRSKHYSLYVTIAPEFNEQDEVNSIMVISNDITDLTRKEAKLLEKEIELLASNDRFTLAAKATTDAIWEINLQTGKVFVSEEFIGKFGYTEAEIRGKWEDWFIGKLFPEDRDAVLAKLYEALLHQEPFWKDEFRWRCKDGSYKYILNQASIFYEGACRPYKAIGAIQDITERKKIEAELDLKDQLLSAVADASNELLVEPELYKGIDRCLAKIGKPSKVDRVVVVQYLYDTNGNQYYLSHKYEWDENGVEPQLNNPDLGYIPDVNVMEVVDFLKAGGTINTAVKDIPNKFLRDCLEFYQVQSLLIIPVFSKDGLWGFIGWEQCTYERVWSGTEIDILKTFTSSIARAIELKEADKRLKASEEKFRALFQSSLDIIFVVDKKSTIKYVTPSIEKILGYPDQLAINATGWDYIHPDDAHKLKNEFQYILAEPDSSALVILRVLNSTNQWVWMEAKAQNKLQDVNINGIILSFRDISERMHAQQVLTSYSETITGILNSITDGFAAIDKNYNVKLWNKVAEQLTTIKSDEIVGTNLWVRFPELTESVIISGEFRSALASHTTRNFEKYIKTLNRWFDATVYPYDDGLFIYFKDITVRKKHEILLEIEKQVLQVNADQQLNLKNTIDFFLVSLKSLNPDASSSVILVEENRRSVCLISATDFSTGYTDAVNSMVIEPGTGSCIQALLSKQMVVVEDIATDPFWKHHLDIASRYAISSCWSIPIVNADGLVIGCLECYFKKNKQPPVDHSLINRVQQLLKSIIENKKAEDKIRIINDRYILALRATNEAVWDWDINLNVLYGGEEFYTLFGYKPGYRMNSSNFWDKHIHPDDREKVTNGIREFIAARSTELWMEEYRLKRSDGNYAIVQNKGYLITDEKTGTLRMIGSISDNTERKHLEKKYIKQEVDKQKLVAMAVLNAQESERAKIGKELHDNVNQVLSTVKLFLEVAKTNAKDRSNLITRSAEQIRYAINEIRHISQSLVPPSISDIGLGESIKDLVESITVTKTLKVDYHNVGDIENSIDDNQKLMLFRIIQEQVNNVLKHAEAKHLVIMLTVNAVEIELKITDDGKGFDPQVQTKTKKGVGLTNIMSRVELFNGKLKIVSQPGKGCKLIVKIVRIPKK